MTMLAMTTGGLVSFILYFFLGGLMLMAFMKVYSRVTPYSEIDLIKRNNVAVAIAYGGTTIGFALPVASAAANSVGLIDFLIWGVVAGVMQIAVFMCVRMRFPRLSERIMDDENAAAILLAAVSLAIGIINAACLTW